MRNLRRQVFVRVLPNLFHDTLTRVLDALDVDDVWTVTTPDRAYDLAVVSGGNGNEVVADVLIVLPAPWVPSLASLVELMDDVCPAAESRAHALERYRSAIG
jgi:hypothetical protein